jgi:hypothetical protein
MEMDTRYKSPAMRAKRSPVADESESSEAMPERGTKQPEATSAFLPPSFFGGQPPEEGKSYNIMVKSVDPETGQAECEMAETKPEMEPAETREQAMDERFGAEQES